MKKNMLFIGIVILSLFCCKKKDCITKWWFPEGESITVNKSGYNKCSDIAKKFNFEALIEDCDTKRLNELLKYDGDTLNIYGCFRNRPQGSYEMDMFFPGEEGSLKVPTSSLNHDVKTDSTIYYARGILKFFLLDSDFNFKKDLFNHVSFYPISYTDKKEKNENQNSNHIMPIVVFGPPQGSDCNPCRGNRCCKKIYCYTTNNN